MIKNQRLDVLAGAQFVMAASHTFRKCQRASRRALDQLRDPGYRRETAI
jgi:hypothetical protein